MATMADVELTLKLQSASFTPIFVNIWCSPETSVLQAIQRELMVHCGNVRLSSADRCYSIEPNTSAKAVYDTIKNEPIIYHLYGLKEQACKYIFGD